MPAGKYKRTAEIKEKNRVSMLGKVPSFESNVKRSNTMKSLGVKPPTGSGKKNPNWKGGMPKCLDCGKKLTQRTYKRCKSCSRKGELNQNYKLTPELCSRWKGGISAITKAIRNLFEYRQWRTDVFTRDNFTCQKCGATKKYLHAHHRYSFSKIIEDYKVSSVEEAMFCVKLWDINNGTTLCVDCHKSIHKKGR